MSAFPSVDKLSRLKWSIIDHKLPESAYRNRDSIVMKTFKSRSFFGNDKLELINVGLVCSIVTRILRYLTCFTFYILNINLIFIEISQ